MHVCGMSSYALKQLPSINNRCGRIDKAAILLCIAAIDAWRTFCTSICTLSHMATLYATATERICSASLVLSFADNCFESVSCSKHMSGGKMTDAATTGPANAPLPASSIPASIRPSSTQQWSKDEGLFAVFFRNG